DKCLQVYGCGNWTPILTNQWLPGKTKSQIISRVQKLIGCQRLSESRGLFASIGELRKYYSDKIGQRKNGILIANELDEEASTKRKEELHSRFDKKGAASA